jgi:hypothetical protein
MMALDTGICVPESEQTLTRQQRQLVEGRRYVQMFPMGTKELPLPDGLVRCSNNRGAFHFQPSKITPEEIDRLSDQGRENEFLNLGPYCKFDVADRIQRHGEILSCITEYAHDGVELRSAAATDRTIPEQLAYFERTKEPGSKIVVGEFPERVRR